MWRGSQKKQRGGEERATCLLKKLSPWLERFAREGRGLQTRESLLSRKRNLTRDKGVGISPKKPLAGKEAERA